jgi:hypothetical protein
MLTYGDLCRLTNNEGFSADAKGGIAAAAIGGLLVGCAGMFLLIKRPALPNVPI